MSAIERPERLADQIERLKSRVAHLEAEVQGLRASIPEERVIVLRTVTKEQAKREIRELFQASGTLYFSDVAERLRLDLPLVVEICQELQEEGDIEVDDNAV